MGGAELLGLLELPVVDVDRDDRRRAGDLATLNGGVADAAAADDGERVAQADTTGVHGRAEAGHDATAEQPTAAASASGSTLVHWPAATSVFGEGADAERRRQLGAVGEVIFWVALWVAKQYHGLPLVAGSAVPADRTPVEDDEVARRDVGDTLTHRLDDPRGLVAQEEGEVVVDAALAVVQVGVAHPARFDFDDRLTRTGIGDDDVNELDGAPLARAMTALTVCGISPPHRI